MKRWVGVEDGMRVHLWAADLYGFFFHPSFLLITAFLGLQIAIHHIWAIHILLSYGNSGKLIFDQTINSLRLVFAVPLKRVVCDVQSPLTRRNEAEY